MTRFVIAKHDEILRQLRLTSLEQIKNFQGELVKDHRGRRDILRIKVSALNSQPLVFFLKRNWRPYRKDGLKSLLRHGRVWSSARQEWENSKALEEAGLRAARLVAFGEDCGLLWEQFSFLITEAAEGGQTIEQFSATCRDREPRRQVIDGLAREIRHLHDAGLAAPDLFTRHIFVDTAGAAPKFCFIDMARLDRVKKLSHRRRARDLAALNITAALRWVSAKERLYFLKKYAGQIDRQFLKLIRRRFDRLARRRKFQDFFKNSEPKVK